MTITVSTNLLEFPKNKVFTKTLEITSSYFFAVNVDMKHNLPQFFTFSNPSTRFQPPQVLKITYNPPSDIWIPSEPLKISFTNKWTTIPESPITVAVNVVDSIPDEKVEEKRENLEKNSPFSEHLECKICLQQFSEDVDDLIPRVLIGCGHTLCQKCVETLTKKSKGFRFQCPFDRQNTSGTFQNLPKNRAVIDMLRELKESETNEKSVIYENPDVPCYENKNHESTCYCTICEEDFCQSCFDSTHSSKIFSTHQSIPLSEKSFDLPNCPIHDKKTIRYFCTDTECTVPTKQFCDDCLISEHKSHWYESIETRIKKNQEELLNAVKNLEETKTKIIMKEERTEKYLNSFAENREEISKKKKEIENHFSILKRKAVEKFENWLDGRKKDLKSEIEDLQQDLSLITETRQEVVKMLTKKGGLSDVDELVEKSKTVCSLDSGIGANVLHYRDYCIPDDMSQEPFFKNV